jgi:CRP-like cAMP-binding protein
MDELLSRAGIFNGLRSEDISRIVAIGRPHHLAPGEYLFFLGDSADRLFVVAEGQIDLCFPMAIEKVVKDITIEVAGPGQTLGWSALVKPYRFTLSARAATTSHVVGFARQELLNFFTDEPAIGYTVMTRISELVGIRLLKVQALWARELQRSLAGESILQSKPPEDSGDGPPANDPPHTREPK